MGFEDETWWSRFERPSLHSWAESGQPMRFIDKEAIKGDSDPKALAAYGMLVRTIKKPTGRSGSGRGC